MRIVKLAVAVLSLLLASAASAEEPFKIVASPDVPFDGMTRAQLSDVFLKRMTTWPGGAKAEPVDHPEGSPLFEAFCKSVHGKAGSVIGAFWKRVSFSGRDTPPAVRASDDEVVAFVRATRGAIGYVSASAATPGVKVIKTGG